MASVRIIHGIGCYAVALEPPIAALPTEFCATFAYAVGCAVARAANLGWPLIDETGRLSPADCAALRLAHELSADSERNATPASQAATS